MAATAQIEADVYVDKARKLMDAVRSAEAEYLTLLSPLHPSQVHTSSSAGADKSTKSDTADPAPTAAIRYIYYIYGSRRLGHLHSEG